ncbi:hypothetical protein [Methylobacterium tarhaniae]|uniref:hypothetical protein n=1 Tax=Methylobacterium tarhaniae TaxID=1187852 RepID=UPI0012EE00C6|nr:hypothetical protein [Methylobacterium tarhaniae]
MQDRGGLAVVGMSRVSDSDDLSNAASVGVGGFVVVDGSRRRPGWALYADVQHEATSPTQSYGLEVAAKNKGNDYTSNPYRLTYGVYGVWLAAGGDDAYGGKPANPSNAALVVLKNKHTWNAGIIIGSDAITGTDGRVGTANALRMAKGHAVAWYVPDGRLGAAIRSDVTDAAGSVLQIFSNDRIDYLGSNGRPIMAFRGDAQSSKWLLISSSSEGASPAIEAVGENAGLMLRTTGSGLVQFGTFQASPSVEVAGYILVKDSSGAERKLAVIH